MIFSNEFNFLVILLKEIRTRCLPSPWFEKEIGKGGENKEDFHLKVSMFWKVWLSWIVESTYCMLCSFFVTKLVEWSLVRALSQGIGPTKVHLIRFVTSITCKDVNKGIYKRSYRFFCQLFNDTIPVKSREDHQVISVITGSRYHLRAEKF